MSVCKCPHCEKEINIGLKERGKAGERFTMRISISDDSIGVSANTLAKSIAAAAGSVLEVGRALGEQLTVYVTELKSVGQEFEVSFAVAQKEKAKT